MDDAVPVARRQYAVHGSGRPLAVLVTFLQNLADGSVQTAASYVKLMKQVCGLLNRQADAAETQGLSRQWH